MKFFLNNARRKSRTRNLNNLNIKSKNRLFRSNSYARTDSKKILTLFKIFLIITCISFAVYYFLFSPKFIIENIKLRINDKPYNDPKVVQQLNIKYKGQNIFRAKKTDIETDIKKLIPNISFIDLQKIPPSEIRANLQEFKEVINVSVNIDNIEKKYVINQNGEISTENVFDDNLPLLVIRSMKENKNEKFRLKQENIDYVLMSKKYFEEKFNILIKYIDYFEIEHEIHLVTDKGFEVWLDIDQSYLLQLHALKLAIQKLDIYNTPLLYIDLRVANGQKIIFKRS